MEKVVIQFMKALGIPISSRYIERLVVSHHDYPSLLSVSETLTRLGVEHAASKLKAEDLVELEYPYLITNENHLVLIKKASDLQKNKKLLENWKGVVLQALPTDLTKDKTNNDLVNRERVIEKLGIASVLIFSAFVGYLYISSFSFVLFLMIITCLCGMVVGYFLIAKDLGVKYEAIENFCKAGSRANCDRVLNSNIKLFGIGFTDAVIAFFIFQFVVLTIGQGIPTARHNLLTALALFSVLTIPVIGFSLYYQKFIVKTWCRICLIVAAILGFQICVLSFYVLNDNLERVDLSTMTLIPLPLLLGGILSCVLCFKKIMERTQKLDAFAANNTRLKNNPAIFSFLLKQTRKIDDTPFPNELIFGNPNAPVKIIMATNLYCGPCKTMHSTIADLLDVYHEQISVSLRFIKSGKNEIELRDSLPYLLECWLENINNSNQETGQLSKLLHDWFAIWDFVKFKEKFKTHGEYAELSNAIAEQHYKWTVDSKVDATPSFFVNGHSMPKEYTIQDVIFISAGIAENIIQERGEITEILKTV